MDVERASAGERVVWPDLVEELPVAVDVAAEVVAVVDLVPVEMLVLEQAEGALADAVLAGRLPLGADVDQFGMRVDERGEAARLEARPVVCDERDRLDDTGRASEVPFDIEKALDELDAEERRISAIRRNLHDKIERFPTDELMAEEQEISRQRRELHERISDLRQQSQGDMTEVAAAALLVQLEDEERTVSLLRRKLHDRLAMFPHDHLVAQERELSQTRKGLHRRIDSLREVGGRRPTR